MSQLVGISNIYDLFHHFITDTIRLIVDAALHEKVNIISFDDFKTKSRIEEVIWSGQEG